MYMYNCISFIYLPIVSSSAFAIEFVFKISGKCFKKIAWSAVTVH